MIPRISARILMFVAGVLVLGAITTSLFRNRSITLRVAAEETNIPIRVFGLGTIEARVLSRIGFEVGAGIAELHADHGDRVKKGDVLARLHSSEQEAKVLRASAVVQNAEANQKKIEANVEKMRAVLAQKRAANRRKQILTGRGASSEQLAEEAQRDEDVAKGDLLIATSDVDVAKAVLADAQAQLAYEKTLLVQRTLTAPFDAMVIERTKELGSVIKAGDPIFTLVAPDSIWALAFIDESRAGAVVVGQKASLRLRSLPQQSFDAHVIRIGLESDRVSEERRVYVQCDNCPTSMFLGEQTETLISVAELNKAVLVPESVVKGFDGRNGEVWTLEEGRLHRRTLSFGLRTNDGRVQVTGGLAKDARVVVQKHDGLREGRSAKAASEPTQ